MKTLIALIISSFLLPTLAQGRMIQTTNYTPNQTAQNTTQIDNSIELVKSKFRKEADSDIIDILSIEADLKIIVDLNITVVIDTSNDLSITEDSNTVVDSESLVFTKHHL